MAKAKWKDNCLGIGLATEQNKQSRFFNFYNLLQYAEKNARPVQQLNNREIQLYGPNPTSTRN